MPSDATKLLLDIRAGRANPRDLFPLVYDELRRVAGGLMRGERTDHTLEPTALVHEAYLRLVRQEKAEWQDRAHFLAIAARAMRQVLTDHARQRNRQKRKHDKVPLNSALIRIEQSADGLDMEALDAALTRLSEIDPRAADVAEKRLLGGMTVKEVGEVLGISVSTVEREWRYAFAWLRQKLAPEQPSPSPPAGQ